MQQTLQRSVQRRKIHPYRASVVVKPIVTNFTGPKTVKFSRTMTSRDARMIRPEARSLNSSSLRKTGTRAACLQSKSTRLRQNLETSRSSEMTGHVEELDVRGRRKVELFETLSKVNLPLRNREQVRFPVCNQDGIQVTRRLKTQPESSSLIRELNIKQRRNRIRNLEAQLEQRETKLSTTR